MPEGENLSLELKTGPNGGPQGGQQSDEYQLSYCRQRYQPPPQIRNGINTFRILGKDREFPPRRNTAL